MTTDQTSLIIEDILKIRYPHFRSFSETQIKALSAEIALELKSKTKEGRPEIDEADYLLLSTGRNKQLITDSEQEQLRNTLVGFAGLSVGSHAAITWMLQSRAKRVKIADFDVISPSNLNRLAYSWESIGQSKANYLKQVLTGINPFTDVISFQKNSASELIKFFDQQPRVNLIVDEVDDLETKISLRIFARDKKLPLLSAVDVGDAVFLDIERYDLKPQPHPFLNRVPGIESLKLDELSPEERKLLTIQIVGFEHNSSQMLRSLLEIGKSIPTWPQLGPTAYMAGGITAIAMKQILLKGEAIKSGRYIVSIDELIDSTYFDPQQIKERAALQRRLKR